MLSRKSKYGLKALMVLAQEAGRGPVLISELARRDAIPKKFLEAILLELKRHGEDSRPHDAGPRQRARRAQASETLMIDLSRLVPGSCHAPSTCCCRCACTWPARPGSGADGFPEHPTASPAIDRR